jgi:uncharacterized protein (DUF1778 family)
VVKKKKPKPKPRVKGSTRMKELGYKPVQIWLLPAELDRLRGAARVRAVTVARFLTQSAMERALQVLSGES